MDDSTIHAALPNIWLRLCGVALTMGIGSAACDTAIKSHLSAHWLGETDTAFACQGLFSGLGSGLSFAAASRLPLRTMLSLTIPAQVLGARIRYVGRSQSCMVEIRTMLLLTILAQVPNNW